MKKSKIVILITISVIAWVVLMSLGLIAVFNYREVRKLWLAEAPESRMSRKRLGSAIELSGNIAVVSIYLDTSRGQWGEGDASDKERYEQTRRDLKVGTDWIEDEAAQRGRLVEFIWDDERLTYEVEVDYDPYDKVFERDYKPLYDLLDETIDKDVIEEFDADGVVYVFFTDQPYGGEKRTCACPAFRPIDLDYDMCLINIMSQNFTLTGPASVAHEILHLFGAIDLYYYDSNACKIPEDYATHLEEEKSHDIMRIVWDPYTGRESDRSVPYLRITDITAYYLGLIDRHEDVRKWDLPKSEHLS